MPKGACNAFAHCYWCNHTFENLPERRNVKGVRMVAFCNSDCFKKYLAVNFSPKPFAIPERKPIIERLDTALVDLKAESLFLPDHSQQKIVDEEIIYFLTYIKEGREVVTRHERSCVQVISRQ